jgi:hypothetical protein
MELQWCRQPIGVAVRGCLTTNDSAWTKILFASTLLCMSTDLSYLDEQRMSVRHAGAVRRAVALSGMLALAACASFMRFTGVRSLPRDQADEVGYRVLEFHGL